MFRKRKVPAAEAASIRKAEESEDALEQIEEKNEKAEDDANISKKLRPTGATGGGVMVKNDEATSSTRKAEEQVYDGTVIEEELEARKYRNPALVTLEADSHAQKKPTSKFGPSSAPAYVRATTIIDYKPDLCKDYNETGYCGYGDTCIYLHDRTTYVSGNVLDQRWDEMIKKGKTGEKEKPLDQGKPGNSANTCGICKTILRAPAVRTRCGHTFCRSCAFERFDKAPTCAMCGLPTLGIFNDVRL